MHIRRRATPRLVRSAGRGRSGARSRRGRRHLRAWARLLQHARRRRSQLPCGAPPQVLLTSGHLMRAAVTAANHAKVTELLLLSNCWTCFQSCAPSRGKCTRIPKFPSCAGFRVQGCCICGLLWEFGAANEACFPPAVLDAGASQTFLHKSCFVFCCFGRQRELARLLLARQPC